MAVVAMAAKLEKVTYFSIKIIFLCTLFTSRGSAFEMMNILMFTDWSHSLPDFS